MKLLLERRRAKALIPLLAVLLLGWTGASAAAARTSADPPIENPNRMMPRGLAPADISVSEVRLVLPITEVTGNRWMPENVDQQPGISPLDFILFRA